MLQGRHRLVGREAKLLRDLDALLQEALRAVHQDVGEGGAEAGIRPLLLSGPPGEGAVLPP